MAEREELIELVTSAHRAPDPFTGAPRAHEAFHDLDEEGRRIAYERTLAQRRIEAALDPEGLTSTARAILRRLAPQGSL